MTVNDLVGIKSSGTQCPALDTERVSNFGQRFSEINRNTSYLFTYLFSYPGTAVAKWLRCCATNRKVAGSIPASVSGFFIDRKSFRSHYGPEVDSASNRNEYQEYFLGLKAAGA